MKKLSFILALFVCTATFAQKNAATVIPSFPVDDETGLVTYTSVIQVPGITNDSLYNLAMAWMKTFYKSPSQVIKTQDKEAGMIDIRHSFQITRTEKNQPVKAGLINYYLTLQFRDGRFKYTVTKINLEAGTYFGIERWINEEQFQEDEYVPGYLTQIDEFMMNLTGSIETGIKPIAPKKEDDW